MWSDTVHKRQIRQVIVAFAGVLAGYSFVHAQTRAASDHLTLNAASDNHAVLPLEPIPITLSYVNKTPRPIRESIDVHFIGTRVRLRVRQPTGKIVEYDGLGYGAPYIVVNRDIVVPPGEGGTTHEWLTKDLDSLFPAPGVYQLTFQALELQSEQWIASNPVTILVGTPGPEEQAASDVLRRLLKTRENWASIPDDELEQFIAAFPTSRYADHARLMVVQGMLPNSDHRHGIELLAPLVTSDRPSVAREAKELLERVNEHAALRNGR
jgi:hypothetical protein